jgi:hypothetical protein
MWCYGFFVWCYPFDPKCWIISIFSEIANMFESETHFEVLFKPVFIAEQTCIFDSWTIGFNVNRCLRQK